MDPKNLTKTSFCDKEIDNITNNDMKKYIIDNMKIKSNISYNQRYAKIYNSQYSNNLNNPHIICFKTSGTPYLLFCTQINDTNYCFLIDKKIKDGYDYPKIFLVHYRFHNELFKGTLFEVELVRDKNQNWFLLIGDIYIRNGQSLYNIQIHDRINQCIDIMEKQYIDDSFCDICPIKIKKYFDFKNIEFMIHDFIPKLSYRIRGFYFVPLKTSYSKILYLFKDNDYKKINLNHKKFISFRIIKTVQPDVYELFIYNEQKTALEKHSYASIPNIKISKWIKELTDLNDNSIVECQYNSLFEKWVPIKEGMIVDTILDITIDK